MIVDVRGTKIDDAADVLEALAEVGKDRRVSVKVLRDHKPLTLDVTLESSPASALDLPPMNWLRELFDQNPLEKSKCT